MLGCLRRSLRSLRTKLTKLINPEPDVEDAVVLEGQAVDIDEEFGFDDDE